ncbi:uncharacterized protein K02A2.6-like [Topomyia yanbarensis]|uniref:uncharacterized protein K02A2.6-like n=1 Tax=Topomyia yanbarensis TaxID=2498891 RepID=UPI00273C486B|nr:uncharacterized protein K02A2.6-like [Topomyia yanbarensis]
MPEVLVTDNGRQLSSEVFEKYCNSNGIMQLKTAPYHPQSNGQAERFVDTFKRTLKKIQAGGEELEEAIDTFLQCYRSTPSRSAPDGKSPVEVLLGRRIRILLSLMKPPNKFHKDASSKQDQQFDCKHSTEAKSFEVKDNVYAKVHQGNTWNWVAGEVVERIGTVMYNVWLPDRSTDVWKTENQTIVLLDLLLNTWDIKPSGSSEIPEAPQPYPEDVEYNELQQEFLQELYQPDVRRRRHLQPQPIPMLTQCYRPPRNRKPPIRYEPYHLY